MRISSLKLLKYGHFSNENLDFPQSESGADFHIVYGPNEAGKSSARHGLEDFLFGIPSRSPHGFRHGNSNMQIGAYIESNGENFEAIRRKGLKETLRDPETNEIKSDGDGVLLGLLHHTSKETFYRMFSLDNERLREGGKSMLNAQDDVGRALFAATAGLPELQSILEVWNGEAAELWTPNKSKKRIYYQAQGRFEEASKRVIEHSVLARDWENYERTLEDIKTQLASVKEQIQSLEPRHFKLSRIRRLKQKVSRYSEIDMQISELGTVPEFQPDDLEKLNGLVATEQTLAARMGEIDQRISQLKSDHDALTVDEKTLEDEDDIESLNEIRAQVGKSIDDLPKRVQELHKELRDFQERFEQLGWAPGSHTEVAARIPSRPSIRSLRELIGRRDMLDSNAKASEDRLRTSTRNRERLERELNASGPAVDVDVMNAIIMIAQRELDSLANLPRLKRQLQHQTRKTAGLRGSLVPSVPEEIDLDSLAIPSGEEIQYMRGELRTLEEEQRVQRGRVNDATRDVSSIDEKIDSFMKDVELVSEEELGELRQDRDALWESLKHCLFDESSLESSLDLTDVIDEFEAIVGEADALSDKRFDNAETEVRYNELRSQRTQRGRDLGALQQKADEIDDEIQKFQRRWKENWRNAPIEVADPSTMLTWWETRKSLIEASLSENETRTEVEQLAQLEKRALQRLGQAIGRYFPKSKKVEFESLAETLAFVRECVSKSQEVNAHRKNLSANLKEMEEEVQDGQQACEANKQELLQWKSIWIDALKGVGLPETENTQQVAEKIEVFDELRQIEARINDLKENRIQPIQSEICKFEARVKGKVLTEYPDLAGGDASKAVVQLKKRLEISRQIKTSKDNLRRQLRDQESQKKEILQEHQTSAADIAKMRAVVGAPDVDSLRDCIRKSDELRGLREEWETLKDEICSDGDGFTFSQLREESDSLEDLDAARTEQSELNTQLQEWREKEKDLLQKQTMAQMQLDQISGSDEAAHAEFDKECAVAEMRQAIEKYIPIRTSAVVLEWAVERFRKERQDPLLKRASQIFKVLTLGSFSQIEVQVQGKEPVLIAYRDNREEVGVNGLSEGTLDQLYLAMRLAAIEEHGIGADASIPFVADDLFTNFDDERAVAGIGVLLELSHNRQVLFFTHHRHLVDLALSVGRNQISVNELKPVTPTATL